MKYARLPTLELEKLEKDFIKFLIINGITGDDWEKMQDDPSRSESIIDAFSDVIWEGVLQQAQYLIRLESRLLYAFSFGKEKAQLILAESRSDVLDLKDWKAISDLKITFQQKEYTKTREMEVFEHIQQGCAIAEGDMYKYLAMKMGESR